MEEERSRTAASRFARRSSRLTATGSNSDALVCALAYCSTSMSTGSRGHIDVNSPTALNVLTGDSGSIPYCPHRGDGGIGEKDSEASSVTDFVGVGAMPCESVEFPSTSTRSAANGKGLRRWREESPLLIGVDVFDIGVDASGEEEVGRKSTEP